MSFLSRISPVPAFPAYSGPYNVGTKEYEIPSSALGSAYASPDPSITTISFRLFYPCDKPKTRTKPTYWIPKPQGENLRAFYRFMSAGPWLATILSYIPFLRLINFTTVPALQDAKISECPKNDGRWSVVVISHGLGGLSTTYSHLCGSLASHGIVVAAPEHRDGSAPLSIIQDSHGNRAKIVTYKSIAHTPTPEVREERNQQLRIRCWELALLHEALNLTNDGQTLENYKASGKSPTFLEGLKDGLEVRQPGKIAWVGHSFGAATIVQFVKSVFYGGSHLLKVPTVSLLSTQITPSSPVSLLDLWTMALFPSTSPLWCKPLPAYSEATPQSGSPPMAILSEGFYKWTSNFRDTLKAVSGPDSSKLKPRLFYPVTSAHLSQSDFGILFPWVTKKALKAQEPERTLKLNVRAILESMRRSSIGVADTSKLDMEVGEDLDPEKEDHNRIGGQVLDQDHKILAVDGDVRGWVAIDPEMELERLSGKTKSRASTSGTAGDVTSQSREDGPGQQAMKHELTN